MVDAVRPESATARQFADSVNQLVAGNAKLGTETEVRSLLSQWRDIQFQLRPLFDMSSLLKEVEPLSQNLSTLGSAGLAALDYLDHGERAPATWVTEQLAFVEQSKKKKAQLLVMVAPSVQKLIEASAGPSPSSAK